MSNSKFDTIKSRLREIPVKKIRTSDRIFINEPLDELAYAKDILVATKQRVPGMGYLINGETFIPDGNVVWKTHKSRWNGKGIKKVVYIKRGKMDKRTDDEE